jgi:hypothetical protein
MIKKAQSGMTMKAKAKAKVKSKADQYDSKPLPKPGKQTPADFMPKSYDTRFKPVKGGGTGNEYLKLGPREKTPGGGFSRNGSKIKKAQDGGSFGMASVKAKVDNNPNPTAADRIVLAKKNAGKAKMGKSVKKCKYGCK